MYVNHDDLITDNIKDLPLWRYMDLWKFLKIINTSSLFFPSIKLLGDKFEGKMPDSVFKMMKEHDRINGREDSFPEVFRMTMESSSENNTFLSCWNADYNESFALWKMYAKDKLGVAIKTDFEGLKASFANTKEDIYIGEVEYFDKMNPAYSFRKFSTILTKNIHYKFETEVRCLTEVWDGDIVSKEIHVDLNSLITEVYLSPFAFESGLYEVIELLKAKHNLKFNIKQSEINDSWL